MNNRSIMLLGVLKTEYYKRLKGVLFIVFLLCLLPRFITPSAIYAATNVSVSPASGTVGNSFSIDLNINTNGEDVASVAVRVNYSGPVSYVGIGAGDMGCTPTATQGTGSVDVTCFMMGGSDFSGTGTIATLTFNTSANGQGVFTLSDLDVGGDTEGSASGATFTITRTTGGGTTDLPETSVLSWGQQVFGVLLLAFGIVLFVVEWHIKQSPNMFERMKDKL